MNSLPAGFKHIEAVLFDLDGTITDYSASADAGLRSAWNVLMNRVNTPFEQFAREYWRVLELEQPLTSGRGIRLPAFDNRVRRFRQLLNALETPPEESLLASMADAYGRGRAAGASLMPGAVETLTAMGRVFRLGLITEGSHETQMQQLKKHRLVPFFQTIVISGDTPYHKPDVELYELAAQNLGVEPDRIIMVGDRLDWDLKPAKQLGMVTILITSEEPVTEWPDCVDGVIHRLPQLVAMVLENGQLECR